MSSSGNYGDYEDAFLAYRGYAGDERNPQEEGVYVFSDVKKPSLDPMSPLARAVNLKMKCWLFPTAFTLFCFATFSVPIYIMSTYIGRDINVEYFIGEGYGRWALFLPVLYLVTHVIHVVIGAPSRCLVLFCLFGSCILLLVLGDQVSRASARNAEGLMSTYCQSFYAKSELETQWQGARTFYATCISATANQTGTNFQDDIATYRLRDCVGYDVAAETNPGWPYLQAIEERMRCAGWCASSQALWTLEPVKDSCAYAVGEALHGHVRRAAIQVIVYAILVLLFLTIALCIGQPVITEWFGS